MCCVVLFCFALCCVGCGWVGWITFYYVRLPFNCCVVMYSACCVVLCCDCCIVMLTGLGVGLVVLCPVTLSFVELYCVGLVSTTACCVVSCCECWAIFCCMGLSSFLLRYVTLCCAVFCLIGARPYWLCRVGFDSDVVCCVAL